MKNVSYLKNPARLRLRLRLRNGQLIEEGDISGTGTETGTETGEKGLQ